MAWDVSSTRSAEAPKSVISARTRK